MGNVFRIKLNNFHPIGGHNRRKTGMNRYDPILRERENVKEQNNDEQETDKSLTIYEGRILCNHEVVEREAKRTIK